jgi:glutamyl endopeptidase
VPATESLPAGFGRAFDPGGQVEAAGEGVAPRVPDGVTSPAGAESVIGADGRTEVTATTSYPSTAIGQITFVQNATTYICSGWLIDPNTVLTSGHCVHQGGTGSATGWSTNLRFTPGRSGTGTGSAPYGTCRSTELLTTPGWINSSAEADDWGVVQLDCNVGTQTGWFGAKADTDANLLASAVTLRGYPGDKPSGTMWTMDDQVRALSATEVFHRADSAGGQSGSPIYQPNGCGGPCGVAVHSYGTHGTGNHATDNHGPRLTSGRLGDIGSVAGANNSVPTPSNDTFAGGATLSGASGTTSGTTVGATKELGEPRHHSAVGGHSIWFRWTAPTAGTLTVDTFGSGFDTVLAAYTGASVGGLTNRASNGDAGGGQQSRVDVSVTGGTTYHLAVDGTDSAFGATTLHWAFQPETVKPTVTITTPAAGATYTRNQAVNASYACADEVGGSGLASCTGTVANGSAIDTATLGSKSFTVTAVDQAGNQQQVTRTYTVIEPDTAGPAITITTPPTGAVYELGQVVTADYSCSDTSGVASCTGTVADGAAIATNRVGARTFRVVATDALGNTSQLVRPYTVVRHRADAHVRRSDDQAFVGGDVVNTTGQGQTRSASVGRSRSATFYVRVQNDGSVADRFKVQGTGTSAGFTVRWLSGRTDVTAAVRAGTFRTASLAPGAITSLRVVLTAKASSARGQVVTVSTQATSEAVPARTDLVRTTGTRA